MMCLRMDLYTHETMCPYSVMNQGGQPRDIERIDSEFGQSDCNG